MIIFYTGTPGSGKSLDVARQMMTKLRLGHNVIGNMHIHREQIAGYKGKYIYCDTYDLNPYLLIEYAKKYHVKGKEGQTYLVIDECQRIFNSRDWQRPVMRAWNEFFQLHRHYGFHVYLITQFDRLVDRQLRALVEYDRIHRKVSNAGMKGKLMSLLCGGKLFVCAEEWYPKHMATGSYFFRYRKKYGEFYDSYAAFSMDSADCVNELALLLKQGQEGDRSVFPEEPERAGGTGDPGGSGSSGAVGDEDVIRDDDALSSPLPEEGDGSLDSGAETPPGAPPLGRGNRLRGFLRSRGIIPHIPKGG